LWIGLFTPKWSIGASTVLSEAVVLLLGFFILFSGYLLKSMGTQINRLEKKNELGIADEKQLNEELKQITKNANTITRTTLIGVSSFIGVLTLSIFKIAVQEAGEGALYWTARLVSLSTSVFMLIGVISMLSLIYNSNGRYNYTIANLKTAGNK